MEAPAGESNILTFLGTAVGGGLGWEAPDRGTAGVTSRGGEFTFSQIFNNSCCRRLRLASLISWPKSCSTVRDKAVSCEALASMALVRLSTAWEIPDIPI